MNKITYLLLLSIYSFVSLNAQEYDEVSIGAGYSKQTFYNLSDGSSVSINNDAWDIAFSSAGQTDGGVFINESSSSTVQGLKLFLANTTNWSEAITDVNVFVDSLIIYNPEKNWKEGAFNTLKNPSSPFDYGWGIYNPQTYSVDGNKIFVIKLRNEQFLKFQVIKLSGADYTFRYARLDGSNEVTSKVTKGNKPLIYFSFKTNAVVDVPTDYDLVFQRYSTYVSAPNDSTLFQEYTVVGALSGPGVQVAKATGVDVTAVQEADYENKYSSIPTTIGHDWKDFNFTLGWVLKENLVYFVKNRKGEKYKIVFVDFQGSSNGTTTVERTFLGTTSTKDKDQIANFNIYPNPFANSVNIESDGEGRLSIYDITGKIVLKKNVNNGEKIDLQNLSSGIYHYQFSSDKGYNSGKIIK